MNLPGLESGLVRQPIKCLIGSLVSLLKSQLNIVVIKSCDCSTDFTLLIYTIFLLDYRVLTLSADLHGFLTNSYMSTLIREDSLDSFRV